MKINLDVLKKDILKKDILKKEDKPGLQSEKQTPKNTHLQSEAYKLKKKINEQIKKLNLSAKEKRLVSLLGIIVIVALGVFIIRPVLDKVDVMNEQLIELRSQKKEIDQNRNILPMDMQRLAVMKKEIEEKSTKYYTYMESQDVSGMITKMMLEKGVEITSLSINMPEDDLILKDYEEYLSEGKSKADSKSDESKDGFSGICEAGVTVSLKGNVEQFENIIYDISDNYHSIRLKSFGIDEDKREGAGYEMDLSLGIVMCKTEEQAIADMEKKNAENAAKGETEAVKGQQSTSKKAAKDF